MNHHEFGFYLEKNAAHYFISIMKQKGCTPYLLEHRYRYRGGEIDLVFKVQNPTVLNTELHFLEVRGKSLYSKTYDPLLSIRGPKINRIQRGIQVYLLSKNIRDMSIHFGFLTYKKNEWSYFSDLIFF